MRIGGYVSVAVALGIGADLLGTSLKTGESYPPGLITGLGVAGATGISLMAGEALMARADARATGAVGVAPTVALLRSRTGTTSGATLGVSGTF